MVLIFLAFCVDFQCLKRTVCGISNSGQGTQWDFKEVIAVVCSLFELSELKPHLPPLSSLEFVSPSSWPFADFLVLIRGLREEVWMWKQAPSLSTSLSHGHPALGAPRGRGQDSARLGR